MNKIKIWIPNLLTLGNLLCGMLSCWISARMIPEMSSEDYEGINKLQYWAPSILILGAAVIDFMDGFVARMLKVSSELGKQLDSLADVVSFGVAPSFLVIGYGYLGNYAPLALSIGIFACVRLAKFNIDTRQSESFLGLPVPSTGLIIASLPFVNPEGYVWFLLNLYVLGILIASLCLLMVSEIPLLSLKFKNFKLKNNFPKYLLLAIAFIILASIGIQGFTFIILAYVLISVIYKK